MANIATQTTTLVNVRASGSKSPDGEQFGGIYYPAHNKNGRSNSARWEGNVALNGKPYTDAQGVKQEGKTTFLRLVVWNGKNSPSGLADTFAKCVSVGKELTCNVRIESFEKRLFINGQALLDPQGNAITHQAINFILEDKLVFGNDSSKVIATEVANYVGNSTFDSRPQFWNVQGHADQVAWATIIVPARMGSVWDGQSGRFGYARVIIPEGVIVNQPQTQTNLQTQGTTTTTQQTQTNLPPAQGTLPTMAAKQLTIPNQQAQHHQVQHQQNQQVTTASTPL